MSELSRDTMFFGGNVHVPIEWDGEKFISENLYEDYLRAVQQERPNKLTGLIFVPETTFEQYLTSCLQTLVVRREELRVQLLKEEIDHPTYNNAKQVADLAEEAIKKYLEKSELKRLVGV